MRTKFIGLDGYKEIENVEGLTRKPKRKSKNKPTRLERYYAERRKQGSGQLAASAILAAKIHRAERKSAPRTASSAHIRRKAAIGLAASFVAAVLCVTAVNNPFAAAGEQPAKNAVKEQKVHSIAKTNLSTAVDIEPMAIEGYGLYIDGTLVGVCIEDGALEASLQQKLDDYKAKYDDETTDEFANSVEVVYGSYSGIEIQKADDIVNDNEELLSYSLSTDIEYTQKIPYDTVTEYDDDEYTDYSETKQEGVNGKEKVVYRITYVDGVQTDSELKSVTTIEEAQDEIVVVGTKEKPDNSKTYSSSGGGSSTGTFIWPVPYTSTITSYYGERWGAFHSGIDISDGGVYGQSIVAADGGTVEWAGYDDSGYGNYVIIDHGNGYKTLYGHCSELYVNAGESVSQGDAIAAVGSTGDSTGPHLHFEVRTSGGERLDPMNFV